MSVQSCEYLAAFRQSISARAIMLAMRSTCPIKYEETSSYLGRSDLLMLWGVGHPAHAEPMRRHLADGKRVVCWDMGYFKREKRVGYLRCSLDGPHPQKWLDMTEPDSSRWDALDIELREDADPKGHVLIVGMGRKSKAYTTDPKWERRAIASARRKFPNHRIVYRPKRPTDQSPQSVDIDRHEFIDGALAGASLVICRHSNVAVDAAIAGVPFQCVDGAAMWLYQREFTRANRLDFLHRLAWWNWKTTEADHAWKFLLKVLR